MCLQKGPCEWQAELGDIARIAEVSFVSCLSCIGQPLGDLYECQAEFDDNVKGGNYVFFCHVDFFKVCKLV